MTTRGAPWGRLILEGFVIVTSILLAFGIDAGWEQRGVRRLEAEALIEIAADFEAHLAVVQRQQATYSARLRASERVLQAVGPAASVPDEDLVEAIGVVGVSVPVRFRGGTLETVVGNAGLSLFRDDELRGLLGEWLQAMEDLSGVNDFVSDEGTGFIDYLRARYPIQDLDRAASLSDVAPSRFDVELEVLLRDLTFANWVYQQYYATEVMLSRLEELARIAEGVLAAASAENGER